MTTQSWWQQRQWSFVADMNGDGAITRSDLWQWLEWLFLMPGDALIARLGPTPLGSLLDLTPKSIGSPASAALSTALWLLAIWASYGLWGLLVDAANPTYRIERRERRLAETRARRALQGREQAIRQGRLLRRFGPWALSGLVALLIAGLAVAVLRDAL